MTIHINALKLFAASANISLSEFVERFTSVLKTSETSKTEVYTFYDSEFISDEKADARHLEMVQSPMCNEAKETRQYTEKGKLLMISFRVSVY